jgi:hypothetical protein
MEILKDCTAGIERLLQAYDDAQLPPTRSRDRRRQEGY